MRLSDFTYILPEEAIAQHPPKVRGASKLLALNHVSNSIKHLCYPDIEQFLRPGDVVVLNNTKVIKARLLTHNANGAERELLLLEKHGQEINPYHHQVLYRGTLRPKEKLTIEQTTIIVEQVHKGGIADISSAANLLELSELYGSVPLPPYMKRSATPEDTERYQTVFAQESGSVAAPTASLNFTDDLKARLTQKGVKIACMTLHVGLGTFLPIRTDTIEQHVMHSEYFAVPKETIEAIQIAKKENRTVLAIGTTVTRTLEYAYREILDKKPSDISGEADIFIYPGYKFKVIDMLLTNFHAPKTTVLMLTAAFAGWNGLSKAYQEALQRNYQFLSYGDSMLIY